MDIKLLKGTFHFGYAYRAGDTTGAVPDEIAKEWIKTGYAIPVGIKERPVKEQKPEVKTTVITRSKNRPVKK